LHFQEAFTIALRSLRANRLRSALTTIGIIIGVSAVIVLVGLGDGIKAGFNSQFGALADQVIVNKLNVACPGTERRGTSRTPTSPPCATPAPRRISPA